MILNAPPEIHTSHTRQASDKPIKPRAMENVTKANMLWLPITLTIETTQSNRLSAPNNCIPRIKVSRFRKFWICRINNESFRSIQSLCRFRIKADRCKNRFV